MGPKPNFHCPFSLLRQANKVMKFLWMIYCPSRCLCASVWCGRIAQTNPELILLIEILHIISEGFHPTLKPPRASIKKGIKRWMEQEKEGRRRSSTKGTTDQTEGTIIKTNVPHLKPADVPGVLCIASHQHMNTLAG